MTLPILGVGTRTSKHFSILYFSFFLMVGVLCSVRATTSMIIHIPPGGNPADAPRGAWWVGVGGGIGAVEHPIHEHFLCLSLGDL